MTTRHLEPTPGWCERAYDALESSRKTICYCANGSKCEPCSLTSIYRNLRFAKPAAKDAELPEELLAACKDLSRKTGPYSRNESIQNLCVVLLAEVDRRISESKPTTEALYQLIHDIADERIGKARVNVSTLRIVPGDKA